MRTIHILFALLFIPWLAWTQTAIESIAELELDKVAPQTKQNFWLKIIDNGMSRPVEVPVIVVKGQKDGPVLCLTAALHGNELNGIRVIQEVVDNIDPGNFNGTLVAIPGLNAISITQHQRRYIDQEDLNRNFPGKETGNRSQQYVWQIKEKILSKIDYLVDMHTASFGRVNTLYVRAAMGDEKIAQMARLQDADIILNSDGRPSANEQIAATRTMRAEAMLKGIPTITIEYGNPQVFQPELISRGKKGIQNLMAWLQMTDNEILTVSQPTLCKKSYWIYMKEGGYLEVLVALNQKLDKGDLIAIA
ncbi:MAG: succinylglutamate desuccinylase/aspartoacylase family protein, partial [Allomuricauda sp.]